MTKEELRESLAKKRARVEIRVPFVDGQKRIISDLFEVLGDVAEELEVQDDRLERKLAELDKFEAGIDSMETVEVLKQTSELGRIERFCIPKDKPLSPIFCKNGPCQCDDNVDVDTHIEDYDCACDDDDYDFLYSSDDDYDDLD